MADARITNPAPSVDDMGGRQPRPVPKPKPVSPIQETDAYKILLDVFGIGAGDAPELGRYLADLIVADPTIIDRESEIIVKLQESKPYKERFYGLTKIREYNQTAEGIRNPMAVMDEGEYLRAESIYKQALAPIAGLYGKEVNKVVGELIGANISSVELQSRVSAAQNWARSSVDPVIKQALKEFYDVSEEDLVAYALDPKTATVKIQQQAGVISLAQEAADARIKITQDYTEGLLRDLVATGKAANLQEAGIVAAEKLQDITTGVATGYNPAGGSLYGVQRLAGMEGIDLTGEQILGAALGTDVTATEKVTGLKSRERARFEGASGGTNVLQTNVSGNI